MPVRLDRDVKLRLRQISDQMGLTASAAVRLLVRSFVEEYDRTGGRLVLPPRWQTTGAPSRGAPSDRAGNLRQAAEPRARYGNQ
ncbi:MAG: type II toxin-antitoxin system RelB/DinJ family antitoxin [Candidatus Marinimicrobia bacterium]|nr:type II toxin-antitoxin system RelB/DinJ family antitoxin [Candidatus Neomarinimicrobiota bacterium]